MKSKLLETIKHLFHKHPFRILISKTSECGKKGMSYVLKFIQDLSQFIKKRFQSLLFEKTLLRGLKGWTLKHGLTIASVSLVALLGISFLAWANPGVTTTIGQNIITNALTLKDKLTFSDDTSTSTAPVRTATFVVAASDPSDKSKDQADYVCDGTDDQVEIQAAIDALPAKGGTVQLTEGVFVISNTIKISKDNIILRGAGATGYINGITDPFDGTFIKLADNSDVTMIAGPDAGRVWFCTIENLALYGNYENQASGHGIDLQRIHRSRVLNVNLYWMKEYGIYSNYATANSEEFIISECSAMQCQSGGFYIYAPLTRLTSNYALQTPNTKFGFVLKAGAISAIGNIVDGGNAVTGGGFQVQGGSDNIHLIGNTALLTNNESFYIDGTTKGVVMQGNQVYRGAGIAFRLRTTFGNITNLVMADNIVHSLTAAVRSLQIDGTGNSIVDSIIENNIIDKQNGVSILAGPTLTNVRWRNNIGYTTENSGTATISDPNTSVTVNHGLNATPTLKDIQVTATNNMGNTTKFWITNPTSTQFTINTDVAPGTGNTATFSWQATIY